jgi:hypothetical protein
MRTINFETFTAMFLPTWVESSFSTTGTDGNLLIGFSKSGYGALDLLFKHSSVFDAAAAWDFPADMVAYDSYGSSSSANYGTDANFQNNYRLIDTFIDTWKAPFTAQDRIWISGYDVFQTQVADFDALLTSEGVLHTLGAQTYAAHNWYSGWLSDAVAGLYGPDSSTFVATLNNTAPAAMEVFANQTVSNSSDKITDDPTLTSTIDPSAVVPFTEGTTGATVGDIDASSAINVALLGQYIAASFSSPVSGFGGTTIYDPPPATLMDALAQPQQV